MQSLEDRTVPATMFGVDQGNNLIRFDSATPGTTTTVPITGLQAGELISGIDTRPATGQLYALGLVDDGATRTGRIYTLNSTTGVATQVGGAPWTTTYPDSPFGGFNFNPNVDLIRIISNTGANFRVSPVTGALVGTDSNTSQTGLNGVSYTNNDGFSPTTTLFGLNFSVDDLQTIGGLNGTPSPNTGQVITVGDTGIISLDSYGLEITSVGGITTSFASANGNLYTVNLANGALTLVGAIGGSPTLFGLTASLNTITVGGTGGNDTLIVTATGANSGSYTLNGGPAVAFAGIQSFAFLGGAGNDSMIVNNPAGGLFAPAGGIRYDGQANTGAPGDTLSIFGGTAVTGVSTPSGPNSGTLTYVNGGTTATYTYAGLEPINDTVAVATFTINATNALNFLNIVNGPVVNGFQTTQVNDGGGGFELLNIANKTNVIVNALGGSDQIAFNNGLVGAGIATFTINGGDGDDQFNINGPGLVAGVAYTFNGGNDNDLFSVSGGLLPAPIAINGDGQNGATPSTQDRLTVNSFATNVFHIGNQLAFTGGSAIDFTTLEQINLNNLDTLSVLGTVDADDLVVTKPSATTFRSILNAGIEVNFDAPLSAGTQFFANLGDGTNDLTIRNNAANTVDLRMDFAGGAGTDNLQIDDSLDLDANDYTVFNNAIVRNEGLTVTYASLDELEITAGGGVDLIDVVSSFATMLTTIDGGGGEDFINVGNSGTVGVPGLLTPVAGAVIVDGEAGGAVLTVDGSGAGVAADYAITGTTVTRSLPAGFGGVTYSNLTFLTLTVGSGANVITVSSTAAGVANFVNTNAGIDTVNVLSVNATGTLTIDTGSELDNVNIGNNGTVTTPGLLTPIAGAVIVNGGANGANLVVDGSGAAVAADYAITSTTVTRSLPAGFGGVTYSNLASLLLTVGSGANIVTVTSTAAGVPTTVNTNAGIDTVNVLSVNATGPLTIDTGSELDNINIGNSGTVSTPGLLTPIAGAVIVNGGANGANLVVDGSGAGVAADYAITNTTVTRSLPAGFGGVTYASVSSLLLTVGSGANIVTVNSTAAGVPTTVNTNAGIDTVNVLSVNATGPLTIDTGSELDNINIGNSGTVTTPGLLTPIAGAVIVNGGANGANLVVDGSGAGVNADYAITGTTVIRSLPAGFGGVTYGSVSSLLLTVGAGANVISVNSTAAGVPTSVNTNAGNDTILMANGVSLNGGTLDGGADIDTIDYSASSTGVRINLGLQNNLVASLDGSQENPAVASTATAAATVTYTASNRQAAIAMTVNNFFNTITDFHIHLNVTGVNGPVIVPIGAGVFVPTGTPGQFTVNTTVTIPDLNEAAFLGGSTYFNIHSTAFPGGEIRGQIFSAANVALAGGFATGTGGIAGFENANGGSLADSIVGNNLANILNGNAGNDTIVGGPGADTFIGGADNDTLVWSNGDGSDVMDGGAGTDTVQVNGSVTAGDVFTVGAGAGGRTAFARVSPGPFTLDIGTVETLRVNGSGGDDSMSVNSLVGVANLATIALNGFEGNDTFNVTPASGITVNIIGGVPATLPGDTLNVVTAGTTGATLTTAAGTFGQQGNYSFGNRSPVNFQQVETLSPAGTDLSITVTDGATTAVPGTTVTYTIVVANNGSLTATGAAVTDNFPAALTGVTYTAVGAGGASGFTAAGAGNIADTVNLPIGATITYTATGTILASATGTLVNTATVGAPAGQPDPIPGNNSATDTNTLTAQADLAVTISDNVDPVLAGQPLTYTITVENLGASDALNVALNDLLPAGTTFLSFTAAAGWTPTAPAIGQPGNVSATIALLPAGSGPQTFTLIVRVAANLPAGGLANTATVTSTTTDPDPTDNSATAFTDVVTVALPLVAGAGAGGGPAVQVFDPVNGALRMNFLAYGSNFRGGVNVAAGDLNGDGVADIITGAGAGGGPHVKAFDGVTGLEFRSFYAYVENFAGGVSVAAGDVNGDGFTDIITGAGPGGGPHVKAFSGFDGSELLSFFAYSASFTGGVNVAAGFVDGDALADIVTGSGAGIPAEVRIFGGNTGVQLRSFLPYGGFLGGVRVGAGDTDGDGFAEIVTGAGPGGGPHVKSFDGATGTERLSFLVYNADFQGGVSVAFAGNGSRNNIATGPGRGGVPIVKTFAGATGTELLNVTAFDSNFLGGVQVG